MTPGRSHVHGVRSQGISDQRDPHRSMEVLDVAQGGVPKRSVPFSGTEKVLAWNVPHGQGPTERLPITMRCSMAFFTVLRISNNLTRGCHIQLRNSIAYKLSLSSFLLVRSSSGPKIFSSRSL
jgi:hypothetical protein